MAAAAPTAATSGRHPTLSDDDLYLWRTRLRAGLAYRARYEPLWEECLAFAEGNQWVAYAGRANRQLVTIANPTRIERVTNDELTQFRLTLLGELNLDDDRPQALFRQADAPTEDYAEEANDALSYGWDEEWLGDQVLLDARRTVIDVGTCPIRCRWDRDYGPYLPDEQPFLNGQLVDKKQAFAAIDQGQNVQLQRIRQGRIVWEAGTPFNTITPPKVHREQLFRWEAWVSVHDLQELKEQYPHAAGELTADPIRSVAKVTSSDQQGGGSGSGGYDESNEGSLDKQCFLYTCYERPSRKHPEGRVILLGSSRMVPLETRPRLDYRGPDGQYRSGVHYLHAIRLTDRFWSRGFMELGLSPQRVINRRLTQINETIDRGQAKVYLEKGALERMPGGEPAAIVWMKPGKPRPTFDSGIQPGPWLQQNIDANRQNLERAVLPDVSLGQNPTGVVTYSQLALLRETATRRLEAMLAEQRGVIVELCEDSACDIKRYWGRDKLVQVGGVEGGLRAFTFDASAWPDYTKFSFAKGSALPRSQGAQLKLIEDLWAAALNSGLVPANPAPWLTWLYGSQQAGKPLDLPLPPTDDQQDKAQYENEMLVDLQPPVVDYFDNHQLHIAEHRIIQVQARLAGRQDVMQLVEQHVQEHLLAAQENAQLAPPVPPLPMAAPPGGGAPPSAPAPAVPPGPLPGAPGPPQ